MYILSVALCRLDDPAIRTPSPPDSVATPTFRAYRQREAKRVSVLVFGVRIRCEVGREASRSFRRRAGRRSGTCWSSLGEIVLLNVAQTLSRARPSVKHRFISHTDERCMLPNRILKAPLLLTNLVRSDLHVAMPTDSARGGVAALQYFTALMWSAAGGYSLEPLHPPVEVSSAGLVDW